MKAKARSIAFSPAIITAIMANTSRPESITRFGASMPSWLTMKLSTVLVSPTP